MQTEGTPLHFTPTLLHIKGNRFQTFGDLPPSPTFTIALPSHLPPPTSLALLSLSPPFLDSFSNALVSTNVLPSQFGPLVPSSAATAEDTLAYDCCPSLLPSTPLLLGNTSSTGRQISTSPKPCANIGLTRESFNLSSSQIQSDNSSNKSLGTHLNCSHNPPATMKISSTPLSTAGPPTLPPTSSQMPNPTRLDDSKNPSGLKASLVGSS